MSAQRPEGLYLRWLDDRRVLQIERVGGDGSVSTMYLARDPEVEKLKAFLAAEPGA